MKEEVSSGGALWPLFLATLAGLSTTIGAVIAVNLSPDEASLAFLLGSAIGVMSTVSIAELWIHKAVEHSNWLGVTAAVVAGGVAFAILDPLLPKPVEPQHLQQPEKYEQQQEEPLLVQVHLDSQPQVTVATSVKRHSFAPRQAGIKLATDTSGRLSNSAGSPRMCAGGGLVQQTSGSNSGSASSSGNGASKSAVLPTCSSLGESGGSLQLQGPFRTLSGSDNGGGHKQHQAGDASRSSSVGQAANGSSSGSSRDGVQGQLQLLRSHHAGLMRLGLLMALTMTLHNMPEGFAVAFSALTSVGPMMCGAIAMHNIPEGLIIAAPIYAATGSKTRAMAIATLSGLSEPLGAAVALFVFRPFVNSIEKLDFVLAFVGGIMLAVCLLELWPEGRKCRQDLRLVQGIALGAVVMGWTLFAGV